MSESTGNTEGQHEYTCPRCQRSMGRAFHFANDGGSQPRMLIRCQYCEHRWSELVERDATK